MRSQAYTCVVWEPYRKGLFIGVRAYLDCSGKSEGAYITLAAFVANDSIWSEFDQGWRAILSSGFRAVPYMHIVEALGLRHGTPFSLSLGWERRHIWDLLLHLVEYTGRFKGGLLTMHSCEIDMEASRRLTAQGYSIPHETALCNRYVSQYIVGMFANKVVEESQSQTICLSSDDLLNFVFDRNESFLVPFSESVTDERNKATQSGKFSIWNLVGSITEGEMQKTPGIQAADILAWGLNRKNTSQEGRDGMYLAHILKQIVMCSWKEYDETTLRREFGLKDYR